MGGMKDTLGDQPYADLFAPAPPKPLQQPQFPDGVPEDVCHLFEHFALEAAGTGIGRYSSDAILHRIRWHAVIERGNREFKCNDHWTAPLARWFIGKHPELDGFFELRERKIAS